MIHPHSKRHRRLMTSKPRLHAAEEPFYRRNPSKTSTKTEKREGGREVLRSSTKTKNNQSATVVGFGQISRSEDNPIGGGG